LRHRIPGLFALLLTLLVASAFTSANDTTLSPLEAQKRPSAIHLASQEPQGSRFPWRQPARPAEADSTLLDSTAEKLAVPFGVRLLVFAPHPDDETIGAGGLIQRVLKNGGQVRVLFVTNGDGFTDGVRQEVKWRPTLSTDFIEYGKRRQNEARQALLSLGVRAEDAVFLGFPDGGIDDLWSGHWSRNNPYISPFTRFDRPRYSKLLSRWARYTGSDLKRLIGRSLREFEPDWILVPDLRDTHPDHSMTGVFVLDALQDLQQRHGASFSGLEVFTYVVHYPHYPVQKAWVREIRMSGVGGCPTARGVLASAHWLPLPLSIEELAAKDEALSAHESQLQTMSNFLRQFLLPYELFGKLEASQLLNAPCEHAALSGRNKG